MEKLELSSLKFCLSHQIVPHETGIGIESTGIDNKKWTMDKLELHSIFSLITVDKIRLNLCNFQQDYTVKPK